MKMLKKAAAVVLPLMLGACAGFPGSVWELEELQASKPTGTPFTQALAKEYQAFAESEKAQYDWLDSQYFAKKGLSAAKGTVVQPEDAADWSIGDKAAATEAQGLAKRLAAALEANRTRAPLLSATAQVKFDCWLEQLEEGWQADHIAACRKDLLTALDALEKQAPAATAAAKEPGDRYTVFFDLNRAKVTTEAAKIIAAAAREAKQGKVPQITVVGHADRSGSDKYNLRLSERRAQAVKDELVKNGVAGSAIAVVGRGEAEPLVATADGVKNPQNRRAVIRMQ